MTVSAWHRDAWNRMAERASAGTLAHALLITGPETVGKRAFAEQLAMLLLCEKGGEEPCGQCRSCTLFAKRWQHTPEETRPDGALAHPNGHPSHPDVRFVGYAVNEKSSPKKMYTEIVIEQMREISAWLALTPQFGRAQVVLIEPADALNASSANALLKTLEEPGARRHLIVVTAHPAKLPATIRSRCQRVDLGLPSRDEALVWLEQNGLASVKAVEALDASGGNPGLALSWSKSGALATREEVAADLRALMQGKRTALDIANRWSKDDAETRLWFAAALAQQQAREQAEGKKGPLALTSDADLNKLSIWFDQANQARNSLKGPLRKELVLLELLSAL
jgi:DNA polymerase III subunit delta'